MDKKVRLRLQTKIRGEIAFQKDVIKTSKYSTQALYTPLKRVMKSSKNIKYELVASFLFS